MNKFESVLKCRAESDENLSVLYTQWQTTKKVVGKNLSYISQFFPHYSLHDASHSESILNNIVRLIGEESIERLSSIDIWLILNSAYMHDIGMIVSANDFEICLKEKKFVEYILEASKSKEHNDYNSAKHFLIENGIIKHKKEKVSLNSYYAMTYLISEYYRKKHSERSNQSINNLNEISIFKDSIPNRLIEILGKICQNHGESFNKLLELKDEENGLDQSTETCHPRFVASMIRLGDLFDLDSNRIPTILIKILGKSLSKLSKYNHDMHDSIKSLNISKKKISIGAVCKNYGTLEITSKWFNYIDEEIKNLHNHIHEIFPQNLNIMLPAIDKLNNRLEKYDTFENKKIPSFSVNTNRIIDMFVNSGVYRTKYSAITELIENACDAIKLLIWLKYQKTFNKDNENIREEYLKKCKNKKIYINIKEINNNKKKIINNSANNDFVEWEIKIKDFGIGMDKEDLEFLTQVSGKNIKKNRIIDKMPEWMKPVGSFGLGFKSVFGITDKVIIHTLKYGHNNLIKAILKKPVDNRLNILLKTIQLNNVAKQNYGTLLRFKIKTPKIPSNINIPWFGDSVLKQTIDSYDFVNNTSLDTDIAQILDYIRNYTYYSEIPVNLRFDNKPIILNQSQGKFDFLSYNTNIAITINLTKNRGKYFNYFYRNLFLKDEVRGYYFVSGKVNILFGKSCDFLNVSKNKIKDKIVKKINKKILLTIAEYILDNYEKLTDEEKQFASMFLWYNKNFLEEVFVKYIKNRAIEFEKYEDYKNYLFEFYKENNEKPIKIKLEDFLRQGNRINFIRDYGQNKILKFGDFILDDIGLFLIFISIRYGYNKIIFKDNDIFSLEKISEIKNDERMCEIDYKKIFNYKLIMDFGRSIIPCDNEFNHLAIKLEGVKSGFIISQYVRNFYTLNYPVMPSPFVKIHNKDNSNSYKINVTNLDDYIYKHRAKEATTLEDIRKELNSFIEKYKDLVNQLSNSL